MSLEFALVLIYAAAATVAFLLLQRWLETRRRRAVVQSLKRGTPRQRTPITGRDRRDSRGISSWLAKSGQNVLKRRRDTSELKWKLIRAGWDGQTAPLTYSALQLWLGVSLPLLAATLAYAGGRSRLDVLLFGAGGLVMASLIPMLVLRRQARLRSKRIRKSLPDALDLMVVCVEAGVGLDAAILRVSNEFAATGPDLAHELAVVNQRVNAGIPRTEALREMILRTGVEEIRSLVTTLVQSDRLGVSIARVLRVSSESLRTKRRQAAQQRAEKAPIKMLVPLILFVLPALMIVIIGPAGIHLVRVMRTAV